MRIIAGSAKGMRLVTPKGWRVRPTLERVREALFSILGPAIEGAVFLDLFAGSGANGLEALSRGAERAVFVENDPKAVEVILTNLRKARLESRAEVRRLAIPAGLAALRPNRFHFVFADPPYNFRDYPALLWSLKGEYLLTPDAMVVFEHAAKVKRSAFSPDLTPFRTSIYGNTALSFFS